MKCYDLFKLPSLKSLELVAGAGGLDREIKWIHFADNIKPDDYSLWVEKHDLVILTGSNLNNDFDLLCSLLPALEKVQIAGILFNTGMFILELPKYFLQLADDMHLPVFVIPWECKLSDVSKDICNCIFSEQNASNAQSRLLEELLFDETLSKDRQDQIVHSLDSVFPNDFYVGLLRISQVKDPNKDHDEGGVQKVSVGGSTFSANHLLYSQFKAQIEVYGASLISVQRQDALVFAADAKIMEHPDFSRKMQALHAAIRQLCPWACLSMGASRRYSGAGNCKQGYSEAFRASRTASAKNLSSLLFFERMGMFRLLTGIPDTQELRTYYLHMFQPVIAYDKANHTDLLSTLFCYLDHGQHLQETAEALFVHKNTLKYRLGKLEALLDADLSAPEFITEIMLARNICILLEMK